MDAHNSHKIVIYDVKNLKVHFDGGWGVPKGDQLFTERDYIGGKVVILEEINGDYVNMMDLICLICQECQIDPDCIRNLIYLFDGMRLEIENDRELMTMWADSKADAEGFTHIFLDYLVPCKRTQEKLLIECPQLDNKGSQQAPQLTPLVSEHTSPLELAAEEEGRAHCPSAGTPSPRELASEEEGRAYSPSADSPSALKASRSSKQTTKKRKRIPEESVGYRKKTTQAVADTLELGMRFPSMAECRSYLRRFAIHNKFAMKFIKNEPNRIRAVCKVEDCPWHCDIVKGRKRRTYKVNRLNTKHLCEPNAESRNSMAHCNWVAEAIESEIRKHGEVYTPKDIQAEIWNKYAVNITYWVAWRARKKGLERIGKCGLNGSNLRTCKESRKGPVIDKGETGKLTKKSRGEGKRGQNGQRGRNASKIRGKVGEEN